MGTMCSCMALTGSPTAWSRRPAANGGAHISCQPRQTGRTCNIGSMLAEPIYDPPEGTLQKIVRGVSLAPRERLAQIKHTHPAQLVTHCDSRCPQRLRDTLLVSRMNHCRTVTDFRKWLDKRGHGGPIKGDPGPILEDRRVLLDRYEQHVKHCKACTQVRACCSTWLQL